MPNDKIYYIYVLRCADNSLYTGITTDVKRRFLEHSASPLGAKYTKSRKPVRIEVVWECANRADASKLEYNFKRLLKSKKEKIVSNPKNFELVFSGKLATDIYVFLDEYTGYKITEAEMN